ncbi:MAG: AAA family ATPase [Pseudomonadota bacterium]
MRFAELTLAAYGRFTGETLRFDAGGTDLHLVYGANAAGKSTARQAIVDALFGFKDRTSMDFRTDQRSLQIGFVVEAEGERLAAVRRKGRKQTLRDTDGETPIDDAKLRRWLGVVGRERFQQAFALDDQALRAGGEAMLQQQDDMAGLLFAAMSGLRGLSQRITAIEERADAAWTARKSQKRAYWIARAEFDTANRRLKETKLRASEHGARRARLAKVDDELAAAAVTAGRLRAEVDAVKLRLWLLPQVAELRQQQAALAELADAVALPEDAAQTLDALAQKEALHRQEVESVAAERQAIEAELVALPEHEPILALAEPIRAFADRVALSDAQLAEMAAVRQRIGRALADAEDAVGHAGLEQTDAAPEPRQRLAALPSARAIERLEERAGEVEQLDERVRSCARRTATCAAAVDAALATLAALPEPLDTGTEAELRGALQDVSAWRGSEADLEPLTAASTVAAGRVADAAAALAPWRGDPAALVAADLPSLETENACASEAAANVERRRELEAHRARLDAEQVRLAAEGDVLASRARTVSAADVDTARAMRDEAWKLFRDAALGGGASPPSGEAAERVAAGIRNADALADARQAAAMAELTGEQHDRDRERVAEARRRLDADREALDAADTALAQRWSQMTSDTVMAGVALERATPWRRDRERLIERLGEAQTAARQLERAQARAEAVRLGLVKPLRAALVDADEAMPVSALQALATTALVRLDQAAERRREANAKLELAREADAVARREAALECEARSALDAGWTKALAEVGLPPAASTGDAKAAVRHLRRARASLEAAADDQANGIDAAERAAAGVAADARELSLALDVGDAPPAVLRGRLSELVDVARARAARRTDRSARLARLAEAELAMVGRGQAIAAERAPLERLAGVTCPPMLREAVRRSDLKRQLEADLAKTRTRIGGAKAGLTAESAVELVGDADVVGLESARDDVERELAALLDATRDLERQRAEARALLETDGGSAAAADAEADRQRAIAAMARAIEEHVEHRMTAMLLRRALDAERAANETPLLKRASSLFETLTGGEFSRLTIDYDAQPEALLGVRPRTGALVGLAGMSAGTRDQLYLALRLAALEAHAEHAPLPPFVADDLFVQFSDDRAEAGFRALADFATTSQVLFFTHHRHLVDLAVETLGTERVHRHELHGNASIDED